MEYSRKEVERYAYLAGNVHIAALMAVLLNERSIGESINLPRPLWEYLATPTKSSGNYRTMATTMTVPNEARSYAGDAAAPASDGNA